MPIPAVQILVCTNERPPDAGKPSCGPRGGLDVYRRFKDAIRARGARDRVMVVRTGCLKHCSRGITVAIWTNAAPYAFWYSGVTPDDVDEIVDESAMCGQVSRMRGAASMGERRSRRER
ncbi:MAG TPA: (2Fe-2S) ferredoxin domain-containing protein [Thermoanaerobaculia bacterium]|nr:(2Fe-2S) ferredoxin domain-containing protein [Thermoanaerobaculia bacterium]